MEKVEKAKLRASLIQINLLYLPGVKIIWVCPVKPASERMGDGEKKLCSIIIKFTTLKIANKIIFRRVTFYRHSIVIKLCNRGARLR